MVGNSSRRQAEDSLLDDWEPIGPILTLDSSLRTAPEGWGAAFPVTYRSGVLDLLVSARTEDLRQHIVRCEARIGGPPLTDSDISIVLPPGAPGQFDADGVSAPWLADLDGGRALLFVGRQNLSGRVPFQTNLGLARLSAEGSLKSRELAPILPLTHDESIGTASCCIINRPTGPALLYTSFLRWDIRDSATKHVYTLREVPWSDRSRRTSGRLAMTLQPGEYALTAPSVVAFNEHLLLAFTARGPQYSLYLAVADFDGEFRRLSSPIRIKATSLDSEMQCYPRLMRCESETFLLYSGNRYGRDGLLAARWVGSDLALTVAQALN